LVNRDRSKDPEPPKIEAPKEEEKKPELPKASEAETKQTIVLI